MEYTIRLKTTAKIRPVMASTNNDKWKIESAGVDSGLKMLGVREKSAGAPKHNRAASRNPAINTRTPVALVSRIRICSRRLISYACPGPLTSDLGLRIRPSTDRHLQNQTLSIESVRFTAPTLTGAFAAVPASSQLPRY